MLSRYHFFGFDDKIRIGIDIYQVSDIPRRTNKKKSNLKTPNFPGIQRAPAVGI